MNQKHHEKPDAAPDEQAITDGLAAIYGDERDDLSTMERGGSPVTRILMRTVIVLATVAIVAYGSYFVYFKFFAGASQNPLTMTFDVPHDIVSGMPTTVTLHYINTARVPLAALAIDVNLPDAFVVLEMEPSPTNIDELSWNIGSIPQKGEGSIVVQGTWLSRVPSVTTLQALATYRPANFNADFDEVATQAITTNTSVVTLKAEGPEKMHPGESATYVFTVENTGELPANGAGLHLTLPSGFYMTSSTPVLDPGTAPTWVLGDIAPSVTRVVTIVGSFTADVVDVQQIGAAATLLRGEDTLTQSEAQIFTDVAGNGLRLQLVANGASGDVSIDPGDPLRITAGYTNTGTTDMNDLSLLLDFTSADGAVPILWHDATLDGGRLTADGILWDTKTLGSLAAGENKMRNAMFPVKALLSTDDAQTFTVVVHATVGGVTIQSQPITVTLNSDTTFTSAARYYTDDGAPIGDGPLPPKVGQTTAYRIEWSMNNSLHALNDVRATATLPPSVTWVGDARSGLGTVAYDDASRTISWAITNIADDAGVINATFSVRVTPSTGDVGTFLKLLSGSALRATDSVTHSSIQLTADALTTDLTTDENAEGKGAVVE